MGIDDDTKRANLAEELAAWWHEQADLEVKAVVPKAIEYGGHGAARDLIDIGADMVRIAGRRPESMSTQQLTEIGIFFYVRGKIARWASALAEGRDVSDDTLHDISVYCRMAQRAREVGGWPFREEIKEVGA